jgi:hypothetical protein
MPYQINPMKLHFELHNEQQDHYEDEYNEINHVSLYYSKNKTIFFKNLELYFTLNADVSSDGALQTADISPVTPLNKITGRNCIFKRLILNSA